MGIMEKNPSDIIASSFSLKIIPLSLAHIYNFSLSAVQNYSIPQFYETFFLALVKSAQSALHD